MEFEKACNEVNFILEHLDLEDRKKIPEKAINFFKVNQDIFYKVELDACKPLNEQKLKEETKAFLQILKEKYLSNDNQEEDSIAKLEFNLDETKEKIDMTDNKKDTEDKTELIDEPKKDNEQKMITIKENKIKKILKKIMTIFRKKLR